MAVNLMVLRSFLDNGYIFHILFSSMGKAYRLQNTKLGIYDKEIYYMLLYLCGRVAKQSLSIFKSESGHFSPLMTPST